MKEYGFMDEGYLHSQQIDVIVTNVRDENGNIIERTTSVEEQISRLDGRWKPVDEINESKIVTEDGYIIRIEPYDAGDHIAYNYTKVLDTQKIKRQIDILKQELAASDYQITKCYEANLLGKVLPYDALVLHTERQNKRDKINELEKLL